MTTAREAINSLNGFEEDAIEQCAGATIDALASGGRDLKLTRALAMVLVYRAKKEPEATYAAAWQEVQALSQTDLGRIFEDEPDDVMPDEPDSAAGKDESESPSELTSSLASASPPV